MRCLAILFLSFNFIISSQSQNLDLDFGDNGISILDKFEDPGFQLFPILDDNGQVIMAGIPNQSFMNSGVFITKLNIDGTVDTDFGEEGYAEYDLGAGFTSVSDFIQLDNGNLVVAGTSFQNGWLVMFDSQGDLVTDFGDNGFFDTQISADNNSIFITQVENRIFGLHKGTIGGSAFLATSYYNMDGTYDSSYGTNGTMIDNEFQFSSFGEVSWDYSSDGAFHGAYFSGYSPNGEDLSFIANIAADGTLNGEYGFFGLFRIGQNNFIYDMALDFDQQLLVSMRSGNIYVIIKLDDKGELVSGFGNGESFSGSWSLPIRNTYSIIPLADRGFIHAGAMDDFAESKNVFQKHFEDGSIDNEIGEVVYAAQPVSPFEMLHADNGDIFIFGFTVGEMSNLEQMFVIKYKSDITDVESILQNAISISPNPSRISSWRLDGDIEISKVQLFDISGKYLFNLQINKDHVYTDKHLNAGHFILSITTAQGEVISKRVLIQK